MAREEVGMHIIRESAGKETISGQVPDLLGLRMISCGETYSKGGEILADEKEGSRVCFVVSGGGMIHNAGASHEVREEMAFWMPSRNNNIYQADREKPWQYVWMQLDGSACDTLLRAVGFLRDNPVIQLDATLVSIVRRMIGELREGCDDPDTDLLEQQMRSTGRVLQMLALMRERIGPNSEKGFVESDPDNDTVEKREKKGMAYVRQAEKYIGEHYAEPLRMDELAKELGISQYYLSHIFRQYRNASLLKFLTQVRIEDSKRMLEETDLAISEVARNCGYPNMLNFSKVFRKAVGCSPSTYRKMKIEKGNLNGHQ